MPALTNRTAIISAAMLLCVGHVWAQEPVILEGEDFARAGAWKARPWTESYFCASFASDFLSRQAFLGAPAQCDQSVAQIAFAVPADGKYALFARYACPYMHNVAFEVVIQQGGRTVYFDRFGRIQEPKIWPFGGGIQPMATYDWGGGDNMVYEGGTDAFRLRAGPARALLIAGPQDEPAAERQVDALLLMDYDQGHAKISSRYSYLPLDGLLTQSGDVFLRITNPANAPGPVVVDLTTTEHSPYWVHGRDWRTPKTLGAQGYVEGKPQPGDFLPVGATSPWVEIGSRLDRLNESTLKAQVQYQDAKAPGIDIIFEFATPDAEDGKRLVRRIRYRDPGSRPVRFAVPGNVPKNGDIRTAEEELERILAYVRSLPKEGRTPERIGIRGVFTTHFMASELSDRARTLSDRIRREMIGDANEVGLEVESLGDEIGLKLAAKSPESDAAFREYLKGLGLQPSDVLSPEALADAQDPWSLVELEYEDRETNPRLWYHSQVFGYENGSLLELKERTEAIQAKSGGRVYTGANYSPHPVYWPREQQWVRPFKLGALTMPWSEDYVWGIPEVSPQVTGYLTDVFRCAAKYRDLPIVFYVMPHEPGNTPRSFRLSYYSALAHGAKLIHHFCVTPVVTAYTENYVSSEFLPMYREIHDIARELGVFEDLLIEGRVRPAQVAMLISGVTDLWDPSPNYNHERKCLYYALRQAGVPVDFLTEDDIAEGRLDGYKALYISASHLHSGAAKALTEWVSRGGVVWSSAGGGLLDEYNRPNDAMLALFGLSSGEITEHDRLPDTKHTLPRLRPADGMRLSLPGLEPVALPALATTQTLEPAGGARSVGMFHNGSPAAVLNRLGKGQALLIGGFPGAAYVSPAIPARPWDRGTTDAAMAHFLPTDFDPHAREVILWAARQAGIVPDVTLSAPLVEWTAIDSPAGTALMLINWTGQPVRDLRITVRGQLGGAIVSSLEQGRLKPEQDGNVWCVTMPLGLTDCIMVRNAQEDGQ
ncbi:MAG: beta-galactosidase trimerization domain-containing protein [Armatimonadetes bacterium]|nr:beta-galactosidase trimerization domain-containing protein [Armatimonadota bacterium]